MGPTTPFLRGRVVSVSDGDTFRFLHLPTRFHSSHLGDRKMADVTLPIRICTIDTPETAKFGKQGQPFGDEAKDYLKAMIMDRIVNVKVLEKDQYGRGVAEVYRPGPFLGWPRKYIDQEMLKVSSCGSSFDEEVC
jgi:endonuclease YncB( thermonuclease family)